ncbi:MAG: lysophospholipid acyltransferase family protein [Chloroflexota bacterium]
MKGEWVYHPGCRIAGWFMSLIGGARIEGVEHLPQEGAFILVANHCSQADPPLLGWATGYQIGRVVHFMAKEEMQRWPVIGWLADRSGVFFVRRGEGDRASQRTALDLLARGKPMGIFPEGTRSRDGRMREVRPGAALLAIRSGAPIIPVGIAGTHRMFPGHSKLPHRTRVTFRIGRPFLLPHQPSGRIDRTALAAGTQRITDEIAALLPPAQRPLKEPATSPS